MTAVTKYILFFTFIACAGHATTCGWTVAAAAKLIHEANPQYPAPREGGLSPIERFLFSGLRNSARPETLRQIRDFESAARTIEKTYRRNRFLDNLLRRQVWNEPVNPALNWVNRGILARNLEKLINGHPDEFYRPWIFERAKIQLKKLWRFAGVRAAWSYLVKGERIPRGDAPIPEKLMAKILDDGAENHADEIAQAYQTEQSSIERYRRMDPIFKVVLVAVYIVAGQLITHQILQSREHVRADKAIHALSVETQQLQQSLDAVEAELTRRGM